MDGKSGNFPPPPPNGVETRVNPSRINTLQHQHCDPAAHWKLDRIQFLNAACFQVIVLQSFWRKLVDALCGIIARRMGFRRSVTTFFFLPLNRCIVKLYLSIHLSVYHEKHLSSWSFFFWGTKQCHHCFSWTHYIPLTTLTFPVRLCWSVVNIDLLQLSYSLPDIHSLPICSNACVLLPDP